MPPRTLLRKEHINLFSEPQLTFPIFPSADLTSTIGQENNARRRSSLEATEFPRNIATVGTPTEEDRLLRPLRSSIIILTAILRNGVKRLVRILSSTCSLVVAGRSQHRANYD